MQYDSLMTSLGTFRAFIAERRIPEVTGYMEEKLEAVPRIIFGQDTPDASDDPDTEVRAYIRCLEGLDVALAVVRVNRLIETEWQAASDACEDGLAQLDDAEAEGQDIGDARRTIKQWLVDAKAAKACIGQISALSLHAITRDPVTVVEWYAFAPWQDAVTDVDERVEELLEAVAPHDGDLDMSEEEQLRRDEWNALEQERRMWPAKRRTETARQVAEAPDFAKAKREADRVYLLRKLLGDAAPSDDYLLKEISREAFAIYRLEVAKKP